MAADEVDLIGDDLGPGGGPQPARSRAAVPAGARTVALTTAVSLVLAGGVATAAYRGAQSGVAPTTLIPSSAFGVAVADLGLPGGQDGALRTFADHFPGSPTHDGDGSTVDRLLRPLLHDADSRIDYDRDVAPWLGDHAAIAGWLDHDGKPRLEVLLQSTDDGSAREHLGRLVGDHGGVTFSDGYAVLSDTAAHATAAVTAAHRRSLADAGTFGRDVAGLPSDEALVGWLDGPATERALRAELGGMMPPGGMGGMLGGGLFGPMGLAGAGGGDPLQARVAAGVHVTDDYAQLDVVQYGGQQAPTASSSLLAGLPADTVGAIELAGPGRLVGQVAALLRSFGSFGAFGAEAGSCTSVAPVPPAVPGLRPGTRPRLLVPPGVPHRKRLLRELRRARRQALAQLRHQHKGRVRFRSSVTPGQNGGSGSGAYSSDCTVTMPPSPLAAFEQATGLHLPGDVQTLLGRAAVVSYGGLQIGALPDVAVRSQPGDLDAARAVADRLSGRLAQQHLAQLGTVEAGGDLVLATSQAYAQKVAAAGELGSQAQVQTALGSLPDEVATAGYVDLTRVWPLLGSDVPADVGHLSALGFWSAVTGDRQRFQMRLVAR